MFNGSFQIVKLPISANYSRLVFNAGLTLRRQDVQLRVISILGVKRVFWLDMMTRKDHSLREFIFHPLVYMSYMRMGMSDIRTYNI